MLAEFRITRGEFLDEIENNHYDFKDDREDVDVLVTTFNNLFLYSRLSTELIFSLNEYKDYLLEENIDLIDDSEITDNFDEEDLESKLWLIMINNIEKYLMRMSNKGRSLFPVKMDTSSFVEFTTMIYNILNAHVSELGKCNILSLEILDGRVRVEYE